MRESHLTIVGMIFGAQMKARFYVWAVAGLLASGAGCGDDDDDGSGGVTFSCGKAGEFCAEYTGSASNIDMIRDASNCTDMGAVEGTGCPDGAVGICMLPQNGGTGTSGAQYYYGDIDEDALASFKAACEGVGGGTFTVP